MTPEGKVKNEVKKRLEYIDAWYFMPVSGGLGRHGIPDFIGCFGGELFAIECKAGAGRLTGLQIKTMTEMYNHGAKMYLATEKGVHPWIP